MERPTPMLRNCSGRRALIANTIGAALVGLPRGARSDPAIARVGYLRWLEPSPTISLLDKPSPDNGLAGARLAMSDDNTTGRFIDQQFELADAPVRANEIHAAILAATGRARRPADPVRLPADRLIALADAGHARQVTLFNIGAPDDALRQENCRDDVIHVAPSRSMLADALAQYLVWKKWSRWVLIYGSHPEDVSLADAYRRCRRSVSARAS